MIPCPILLAMERDQLGMPSVRILTSLQILVKVTFMTKHIQVTRARSSPAGCSNLSDEGSCDNARVVMFGKCRVPEALPPTYK